MATLLTGAGYIGAALLRRLIDPRCAPGASPVVVLDNFFSTAREDVEAALPPNTTLIEGDVAEPADVARAFAALPDAPITVFHLAAQPSAAIAAREPTVTERSNLVGARVVLEAARARDAHVVFGGSFRVYGDELIGKTVDEDTPYGRLGDLSHLSKVYVEQLARMLGVRFTSVRLGVTYGLSPVMKTAPAFMTVPNLFCQRAARGEALDVLEDRPMAFIHVADAARALLAGAHLTTAERWQVVNAAPEVATIGEVGRIVQRLARQHEGRAELRGATPSEATFEVRSRMPLQPCHTLATGLGEVLDYFSCLAKP
ncbi:MAG: NAD(P)-dependent oxidoreductase [Chloroflexi bacterium]|nr:NAD(P)-dependent oxidoreductase [Chloroflexota bacterium]